MDSSKCVILEGFPSSPCIILKFELGNQAEKNAA